MRKGPLFPRTALLFGLLAGVAAACGGDSSGPVSPPPPPPPPPNRAPTAVGTLPAVRVAVGESSEVQLAGGFNDPDGDALSYAAVTSNADVATVTVAGSVATVTGVAKGVATISVTATDPGGASARQVFEATVPNRAPETSGTIEAIELAVGETETLDVSQYFSEPDGDELSYAVASSDPTSVTAIASGNAVTVTAVAAGTATITVTATDPDAASAEQSFDVTVPNRAPEPTDAIPDQALAVGDSAVFELQDYFSDPDGDTLTYASASSDEAVAAVSVSGSMLTVHALAKGSVTISVTVTDRGGLTVSDSFDITVPNQAPTAVGMLPAVRVAVGESSEVQLAGGFNDPDGDALSYAAVTSNADVATVAVVGSVATVTGVAKGVATMTVTATDPGGASARQVFEATVPNRAPETSGMIEDIELAVGETETLDVSQYFSEPDEDELSYSVASSDTTSVTAIASGNAVTVTAIAAGTATITVTATDTDAASAEQSFDVTVPNRAPEPTDTIPDQELAVGDSVQFELQDYFSDPDGDTLTYTSESSDETLAAVSVSGSMLTVRALAKGSATISVTATDGGGLSISDSFDITVPNQAPVVTDTIPAQRLTVGETGAWAGSAFFSDPDGDGLTYAAGTTDAAIVLAIVSGGDFGIVAVSPGTATVTVTATDGDGLSASQGFEVVVRAQGAVDITDVEPAVLLEGAPATIRGSGFSTIPANNTVVIDGLAAIVNEATSTSLSITVPYADCLPPRHAELRVTAGGSSDARTVGVTPRSREDLDLPPSYYRYTFAGNGCLHLPGDASGGDYLIGVVSTSEVPSSLTPVVMTSIPGDATVLADALAVPGYQPLLRVEGTTAASVARIPRIRMAAAGGTRVPLGQESVPQIRNWQRHNEIMAANEELLRRLGPPSPSAARAQRSRTLVVNDTLTLFVGFGTCETRDQVRAVVRMDGSNTVWLEDIDNPSGTFTQTELEELDAFYAAYTRGVHDEYFGAVPDVDGNGKILILMTKEENRANVGGRVWSGDLYPPDQCGTSNHAEIFFGRVPDPDSVFGTASTKQQTLAYYPSLLTHEIAHIVQFGALLKGARFATWELEGGATLSEQLVAYRLFGHGSGQNLGYAAFQQGQDWYIHWVAGLASFFGWDLDGRVPNAPEQCSWVGRPEEGNDGPCSGSARAAYDVPSVVLRYAMDRWGGEYPGAEQALMRRLTQSSDRGFSALERVSTWRIEQILADFYIALWLDLNGSEAYGMTSWNLADIWSRLAASAGLRPYPENVTSFRGEWSVRAGSTFYLHWTPSGSRGPTSLKVISPGGAPVPGHMSVWALRIR